LGGVVSAAAALTSASASTARSARMARGIEARVPV
jgi:hypothetical protein